MAVKFTISVNDETGELIQKWRPKLQISDLFRKAAEKEIRRLENLEHGVKEMDMEAIVERLKAEKEEMGLNLREEGNKEGLEWASTAHYQDLIEFTNLSFDEVQDVRDFTSLPGQGVADLFNILDEGNIQNFDHDEINKEAWSFIEGFKEAVDRFWKEVRSKLS